MNPAPRSTDAESASLSLKVQRDRCEVLQTVLDGLPQRVFWKGPDLCYLGCNRAFAEDAGLDDPAEIVGMSDLELPWSEEQTKDFRADDRKILSGSHPSVTAVEPIKTADGSTKWLETRKVPLRDADGSLVGALGTYCDVTARETAARSADKQRKRLDLAMSGSGTGMWDWNVETDDAFFSEQWAELIGRDREDLIPTGAEFINLTHPSDRPQVVEAINRHLDGETDFYEATFRLCHEDPDQGDDGWVWIRARGRLIERTPSGEPLRMIGVQSDVTEQKLAEAKLQEAEDRFRSGFDQAAVPTALSDLTGRITRVNAAFVQLVGRPEEDVVGRGFEPLTHPDDVAECRERFEALLAAGTDAAAWEKRYVRPDGTVVHAALHLTTLRDPNGQLREVLVHALDVTDRIRAEEQLRAQEEALRHKHRMEAVGSLAGGISHEFNNLLQAITGYASFAAEAVALLDRTQTPDADEIASDLKQIEVAADRAAVLTRQLLDFSRKDVREPDVLDAGEEVEKLLKMIRPLIGEFIELHVEEDLEADGAASSDGETATGRIFADPTELQQALVNLCVNARDAMEGKAAGSRLTIRTSLVTVGADPAPAGSGDGSTKLIVGASAEPGQYVRFEVADTGPGIPAEVRDRVFDPFFTTKPPGRGTGMGLAVVYGAAEHHGGRVTLDSSPAGTTFGIELPAIPAEVSPAESCSITPANAAERPAARILLAEDDPLVREVAVRVLSRGGFEPLPVGRGDDAVAAFQDVLVQEESPIALLLFDVMMPGLTGREALDRIRIAEADAGLPHTPVLFCTGYDPDSVAMQKECEGLPQIRKPIRPAELLAAVRSLLADAGTGLNGSTDASPSEPSTDALIASTCDVPVDVPVEVG